MKLLAHFKQSVKRIALLGFAVALSGCGSETKMESPVACTAPAGHSLTDIQSVVDWINAMDKPLSLPCFVESLPRPLKTFPSLSSFSAQPSIGPGSPRVFFFFDKLMLTVAADQNDDPVLPAELEDHLLEMSFLVDEAKLLTTKGEIVFPVTRQLTPAAPYTGFMFSATMTTCALCHPNEKPYEINEDHIIFESTMLRPTSATSFGAMQNERDKCDPEIEPHRCAMLASMMDHGPLEWQDFPANAPTIFDN